MNPTPQIQKPKIDNHGMYLQLVKDYPPQYKIGDKVRYYMRNGSITYIGIINCCVFNDREKNWKYTVNSDSTSSTDDIVMIGKIE